MVSHPEFIKDEKQATKSVQEALKGVTSPPTLAELISLALVK